MDEAEKADVIFVIGSNTTETHPVAALGIKKAVRYKGAKLIVADPRRIDLCRFADLHLGHRPGTDAALINGLLKVIIDEDLTDKKFISERTEGFDDIKDSLNQFTPEYVEKITGVPKERIINAARMYANAKNALIYYTMGITQHTNGTGNVRALANLVLATGKIGREGSGLNPLRGQNNVQGACDVGALPEYYSGYQKVNDEKNQEKFEKAWGAKLSNKLGLTATEMTEAADAEKIKAMYVMGENPMLSDPDINHTRKAFEKLEFLVVQDIFMSETAELADVVLPASCFAEKDGTFTNTERRVQRVRKAVEPPGEAMEDWKIIMKLSNAFGYKMEYKSPADIMDEIASNTPQYAGISFDRLEGLGIQWPCPDKNHPGTKTLHKEKFTRGKGQFTKVEFIPSKELPDDEYPFILTTGRMLTHYHTGTMTRRSAGPNEQVKEGYVEISPEDANRLGVKHGEKVKVTSRRGQIDIKAKVTDMVSQGIVFIPFHFKEAAANMLTSRELDPVAKIPELKSCAVKVEKRK
jgi:formate dehydrogenase alpha subunit